MCGGYCWSDSTRSTRRSPPARSTGRLRKGRLKGADKGRCCGRGREEKKSVSRRVTNDDDDDEEEEDGGTAGGVIGKRVREVRFNTRTSSSFYTRWFYIRPLSCYQPSAVWVHSHLRRHRDPGALVLASSCTRIHTYVHRVCSSVLNQSGGDAWRWENIVDITRSFFFFFFISDSIAPTEIRDWGLTVVVVALKRARCHRDSLASMSKIWKRYLPSLVLRLEFRKR